MKILLANKFFYPRGGDCIHTIALKNLLEANGHKVAVFSMHHPENLDNEFKTYWPSALEYSNKKPTNLKETILRPIYSSEVKEKWNDLLRNFQPDIVHCHNIHTQLSPIIVQESYRRQIPVIWTLHDYKIICPASACLTPQDKVCDACIKNNLSVIKKRCIKNSLIASTIGFIEKSKWNKKKLNKYVFKFISPSLFLKTQIQKEGISTKKITQLYNFIDHQPSTINLQRMNYAVFVGRLSKEKGIETLLEAATNLKHIDFKIIGDGPLKNKLELTFTNKNISFLGFKKSDEVNSIISKAKFSIVPSEWFENNPLSMLESLINGTPVLGADIGGIPELIDSTNGILFKSGDKKDLEKKIYEISSKTYNYQKIGKEAQQKYSASKYINKLTNLYNQAITNENY